MKTNQHPLLPRLAITAVVLAGAWAGSSSLAAPSLQATHDAYFPGEDIQIAFQGGPGNAKDWIGVYPVDIVPGSVGSTIWRYVDGTQGGSQGLTEGLISFPGGLNLAGDWAAYLLLNDGYTQLATNLFKVLEPGSPVVRVDKRRYEVGESITVAFTNGPAGAKDWVGIYKAGQVPGGPPSTVWAYVDGTQTGSTGNAEGSVRFASGLAEAGDWVVHFLRDDGYDILASEMFTVVGQAPVIPRIIALTPSTGSSGLSPALEFSASITNGTSKVVASTVQLLVDGVAVVPTVTTENNLVRVTYAATTLAPSLSEHTWVLSFQDDASPAHTERVETRGTVRGYRNIVLSNPVVFENFDAVPEGSLPVGWTEKGYSTPLNEAVDFGDLGSAAYRTWTTVDADRFKGTFVTYANAENPASWGEDYRRVLTPNPANVVNGAIFSGPFAKGRFLFGNSGYQNGASSQVLFLFTPDFDLTGKTNVHLGFNSLWEQNQDSIAAIEYSIDAGQSWLPIAYFLAAADVLTVSNEVTGKITIDAEATFNTEYGDVARYVDDQGTELGGTYGAFIGAPISPDLAPYIQGRVDDNATESKRVEWFRLPAADNQRRVRLRFAHAGTDSWYFGIDDFGLYAPSVESDIPPLLAANRNGQELTLTWSANATGYVLESSASVRGGTWQAVPGVTGSSHKLTLSGGTVFFRLKK